MYEAVQGVEKDKGRNLKEIIKGWGFSLVLLLRTSQAQ